MSARVLAKSSFNLPEVRAIIEGRKAHVGFDYPTQQAGKSTWVGSDGQPVTVYYDPATGGNGQADSQFTLSFIDQLMAYCDAVFGVRGQGGNVIFANVQGGGAYHYGCSFSQGGDWYESADPDTRLSFGLVMAEVSESYMGLQGKGWNCGGSGGEALSRVLAEIVSGGPGGSLSAFASGPSWDGTDWISRDQGTDGDYPSIGCGVLYLWWMLGKYTITQIVQAGEPDGTLASNYAALTGKPKTQAFSDFKAAVAAAGGPTSDNPFNTPTPPWQGVPVPPPPPPPPPPPTAPVYDVTLTGSFPTLFGHQTVTLTGKAVPETGAASSAGGVNWLAILRDAFNLFVAAKSGNAAAVQAALQKLLSDLGL